jgi:gluconate 5-dehydrogenase
MHKEIEEFGVTCRYYVCDVMQTDQIKNAVGQVEKEFGRIDTLVINPFVGLFDNEEKTTDEM